MANNEWIEVKKRHKKFATKQEGRDTCPLKKCHPATAWVDEGIDDESQGFTAGNVGPSKDRDGYAFPQKAKQNKFWEGKPVENPMWIHNQRRACAQQKERRHNARKRKEIFQTRPYFTDVPVKDTEVYVSQRSDGDVLHGGSDKIVPVNLRRYLMKQRLATPHYLGYDAIDLDRALHKAIQANDYPRYLEAEELNCCGNRKVLGGLLGICKKYLTKQGFPPREGHIEVTCGGLRAAVRNSFGSLNELQELSIKTAQKLETSVCKFCEKQHEEYIKKWEDQRFQPVDYNPEHLGAFKDRLRANVEKGWNTRRSLFVPNGHATLNHSRREGGNWNEGVFEDYCSPTLVLSSGKPRVVTKFSEYNTRVLTPLHNSLYKTLQKKGWLLVGDPTDEKLQMLNGEGKFVSIDYRAATDNIKTVYVRAAVEVLIQQAQGLTEEQKRCMRVLGELRLSPGGDVATTGQPMGSVMSFPLLCLINKVVIDMSLSSLLVMGQISVKEWSEHRCLINGDDCVLKEPRAQYHRVSTKQAPQVPAYVNFGEFSSCYDSIIFHGVAVGLIVNEEKTMISENKAEINSTLFLKSDLREGKLYKTKKENLGALRMGQDVDNVLEMALKSTTNLQGFRTVVRANVKVLSKQTDKQAYLLPVSYRKLLMNDSKISKAMVRGPDKRRPPAVNRFPVVERPHGYDLTPDDEYLILEAEVDRQRKNFCMVRRPKFRNLAIETGESLRKVVYKKRPLPGKPVILDVMAREWSEKQKRKLAIEDFENSYCHEEILAISDESPINALISYIKSQRRAPKKLLCYDNDSIETRCLLGI